MTTFRSLSLIRTIRTISLHLIIFVIWFLSIHWSISLLFYYYWIHNTAFMIDNPILLDLSNWTHYSPSDHTVHHLNYRNYEYLLIHYDDCPFHSWHWYSLDLETDLLNQLLLCLWLWIGSWSNHHHYNRIQPYSIDSYYSCVSICISDVSCHNTMNES